MPKMNGFALCEALRARGCHVPIIFMTAFSEQGHEQRARASGAACFVNKPFEDTEIIRCIERALSLSGRQESCSPPPRD
jgi:CheY-like chemotaxis protein